MEMVISCKVINRDAGYLSGKSLASTCDKNIVLQAGNRGLGSGRTHTRRGRQCFDNLGSAIPDFLLT